MEEPKWEPVQPAPRITLNLRVNDLRMLGELCHIAAQTFDRGSWQQYAAKQWGDLFEEKFKEAQQ